MFQAKERAARTVQPFPVWSEGQATAFPTRLCRILVDNSITILPFRSLESRPIFLLLRDD